MRHQQALGRYGEDVAAEFLEQHGMPVLERNWRCAEGEIDIVAREASTLIVCEVKTRSSLRLGHPAEAITPRKLKRLRHLAYAWMSAHGVHAPSIRIDVVTIVQGPTGPPQVEHRPGVG